MLEQALELDPEYAEAWAGLAAVSVVAPSWGLQGRDFFQLAKEAAQRAIELDDSLGLPYAVLGSLMSNSVPTDYVKAFEYYDLALARDPNAVNALLWRGIDLMNVGEFEAATADLEHCLVIDPLYENCRRFLALTRLYAGDTERALALFEQGVARGSASQTAMFSFTYLAKGDPRSAMFVLALSSLSFRESIRDPGLIIRALTEPGFDHDHEWQKIVNAYESRTGETFDENSPLSAYTALAFRKYDALRADPYASLWWHPNTPPDFRASPHRKRLIREMGIYDYWLEAGFPPQCRPVGENAFECD